MEPHLPFPAIPLIDRLREQFGERAVGIAAALALEALLILLLLTLQRPAFAPAGKESTVATFDISAPPPAQKQAKEEQPQKARPQPESHAVPVPKPPPPAAIIPRNNPMPAPQPMQATIVPMSRDQMASADIANLVPPTASKPRGPAYGPSMGAMPGDSTVVGKAPDGQPLYAARWYREPTHNELAGYLSTASGPGWALIACKTASQWRVEDCVGLDEYPAGSNLQRAVLAAAWQFQVRPPSRGGQSLVGSWVRIRIEYESRSGPSAPGSR